MRTDFVRTFGIKQKVFTFDGKICERTDYYLDDKLREILKWVDNNCANKNEIHKIVCYWETIIEMDGEMGNFKNMKNMIEKIKDVIK